MSGIEWMWRQWENEREGGHKGPMEADSFVFAREKNGTRQS